MVTSTGIIFASGNRKGQKQCLDTRKIALQLLYDVINIDNMWRTRSNMEIDKLIKGADSEIHSGTKNQMAGAYSKNGPSKTN
jgi:hypothetical protein